MKLSTWIDKKGGNAEAGVILGVRRNCAYSWTKGIALPRPEIMKRIFQKTNGKVTYGEMIDEYLEKRKPKKKTTKYGGNAKENHRLAKTLTKADKAAITSSKKLGIHKKTPNGKKKKSKTVDPGF